MPHVCPPSKLLETGTSPGNPNARRERKSDGLGSLLGGRFDVLRLESAPERVAQGLAAHGESPGHEAGEDCRVANGKWGLWVWAQPDETGRDLRRWLESAAADVEQGLGRAAGRQHDREPAVCPRSRGRSHALDDFPLEREMHVPEALLLPEKMKQQWCGNIVPADHAHPCRARKSRTPARPRCER